MLLTVLLISGTILGATTIAGLLMLYQIRQATNVGYSLQALFAADSGVEWKLYQELQDSSYPAPVMSSQSNSNFIASGSLKDSITSVGCAGPLISSNNPQLCPRPINRAFQLIFE